MIPTMLLVGIGLGLLAVGGVAPRSVAIGVATTSLLWGIVVGVGASSAWVGIGGTALSAVDVAVGAGVVWSIAWPIRRTRSRSG